MTEDQSIVRDYLNEHSRKEGILSLASLWECTFEYSMGAYLTDDLAQVVEALNSLTEQEQYEVIRVWADEKLENS